MKKSILLALSLFTLTNAFAQNYKIVGIFANDIVYVPNEDKLYASTPGVGSNGNSICMIDPYLGTVEDCFFIGSNPGAMALSDDGSFLYVGLIGSPQIVKFDMVAKEIAQTFSLGADSFFGPYYAEEIRVLPAQPNSIAVSRMVPSISPRHQGVAVYDNGVQRPNTTQTHTGSNSICFANATDVLYGYNNETTEFGFRNIGIYPDGVVEGNVVAGLVDGFGTRIEAQGDMIYSSRGHILDVGNPAPVLVGTCDLQSANQASVEPAIDSNVVFYMTADWSNNYLLKTFNKNTFNFIGEQSLSNVTGNLGKLISWGNGGKLAFNTSDMVVIFENCTSLITDPLAVSPSVSGGCWGSPVLLSAAPGFDNYLWSNGSVGPNIVVTQPGEYSYAVADALGCYSQPSAPAIVQFGNQPSTPYILANGSLLASSAEEGNQWFLNGVAIPGANGQFFLATESGFYSVQSNDNGCLSQMSDLFSVIASNDEDRKDEKAVVVYPVPAHDFLNISYDPSIVNIKSVRAVDAIGKAYNLNFTNGQSSLEGIPNGFYSCEFYGQNGGLIARQKIIKMQ